MSSTKIIKNYLVGDRKLNKLLIDFSSLFSYSVINRAIRGCGKNSEVPFKTGIINNANYSCSQYVSGHQGDGSNTSVSSPYRTTKMEP